MASVAVTVNRAPVLTFWAAVVAERLGFDWDEALTIGRAVAGLNAHSKGVRLGLFTPAPKEVKEKKRKLMEGEKLHIDLLGRAVPAVHMPEGLRAVSKDRPIAPSSVARYLEGKFGEALPDVRKAMETLPRSMPPEALADEAFKLYEQFRPEVPAGVRGGCRGPPGHAPHRRARTLTQCAAATASRHRPRQCADRSRPRGRDRILRNDRLNRNAMLLAYAGSLSTKERGRECLGSSLH